MLIAHQRHQNKWSDVAQDLKGRSNNTIKNRFYSIFRKVKNKIKRRDLTYGSKLELLEMFYMISLMERYFTHPQPITEQKGKRGKDFIYSLLRSLRLEDVINYKTDLQKMGGKETSLEELWLELANQGTQITVPKPVVSGTDAAGDMPIDLISISEVPVGERAHYILPPPHTVSHPEGLTPDEKDFIHYQVFQNREPCSAGAYLHQPQPMMMSPPVYRTVPFSAGKSRFAPATTRFEGFSDYTDIASTQHQFQPHPSQPVQPKTGGLMFGGSAHERQPPPHQDVQQDTSMPQLFFPIPMFKQPPLQ